MTCCLEEHGHPKDIPDIKNPVNISHHYRYSGCSCGCADLKQKVADLEYAIYQFQLKLDKVLSGEVNVHLIEYGGPEHASQT